MEGGEPVIKLHSYNTREDTTGQRFIRASLQADELPDPMPTEIDGTNLDAGSKLKVLADGGKEYVYGENAAWYEQEQGGGDITPRYLEYADIMDDYKASRPPQWPEMPVPDEGYAYVLCVADDKERKFEFWDTSSISSAIVEWATITQDGKISQWEDIPRTTRDDTNYRTLHMPIVADGEEYILVKVKSAFLQYGEGYDNASVEVLTNAKNVAVTTSRKSTNDIIADEWSSARCPTGGSELRYITVMQADENTVMSFSGLPRLELVIFGRGDGNRVTLKNVKNLFKDCTALRRISGLYYNGDKLGGMRADITSMCENCSSLIEADITIKAISGPTVSTQYSGGAITTRAFYGCSSLVGGISLDPAAGYLPHVQGDEMFYNCKRLTSVPVNMTGIRSAKSMFENCINLNTISDIRQLTKAHGIQTSDLSRMFYLCRSLEGDLTFRPYLNKATDVHEMFFGCDKITSIAFGNMNISDDVKYSYGMFKGCTSLTSITDSADGTFGGRGLIDTSEMFLGCKSLEAEFDGGSAGAGFILDSCEIARAMFSGCTKLKSVTLSGCQNITDISQICYQCPALTSFEVVDGNLNKVQLAYQAWHMNYALSTVDVTGFAELTDGRDMFRQAYAITELHDLDLSKLNLTTDMFASMNALQSVTNIKFGEVADNPTVKFYALFNLSTLTLDPTSPTTITLDLRGSNLEYVALLDLIDSLPTNTAGGSLLMSGNPGYSYLSSSYKDKARAKGWVPD